MLRLTWTFAPRFPGWKICTYSKQCYMMSHDDKMSYLCACFTALMIGGQFQSELSLCWNMANMTGRLGQSD
jgi:hypothetical protein